jgi:pimeloyl-ACP methyl ester carboxylesterase
VRADEVAGVGELAGLALGGGVQRVAQAHAGIAERVFDAVNSGVGPAARPVQVVHDRVTRGAYGLVQSALTVGARSAGAAVSRLAPEDGPDWSDRPAARIALGVLNGAHGDLLAERVSALSIPMSLRHGGADLPVELDALQAAYPDATNRVVVFLHGLVETEDAWRLHAERHHGDSRTTYGTLLARDLGFSPVWVRYNTGLHVSDNGAELDALLGRLVEAWPVPIEDLVLVGHSMGGLVARSALALAGDGTAVGERRWPGLVRDTITLGTPHLGAPLEQGVHRLSALLRKLPETRWLADQLDARSVGVQDLGSGALLQDEWTPDGERRPVPLHDGARHFVVLATVSESASSQAGRVLGDLLVQPSSASGDTGEEHRLAYPEDAVCRLNGLHHVDLLNHPEVYAAMLDWLTERPARDRDDATPGELLATVCPRPV